MATPGSPFSAWSYGLVRAGVTAEYGLWSGDCAPALAAHFHAEPQLTIVLSGGRAFQAGAERYAAVAEQCVYLPQETPHRSEPLPFEGTRCVNLYLPTLRLGPSPLVIDAPDLAREAERGDLAGLLTAIARRWPGEGEKDRPGDRPAPRPLERRDGVQRIGDIAAREGLSREGFSRRFARRVGMPPHAYRLVERLNEARRRLRQGESLAALAAELDFADQSHFGRHFRRAFGVTPRAYRESVR